MRMGLLGALRRRRLSRAGLLTLGGLGLMALGADCLASDLPLLLRFQGRTYLLPAITRPAALTAHDNQSLRRVISAAAGDWAWMPLGEYGPEQQPEILRAPPASPDGRHWLGTDDRGRDIFARLVHGSRVSLIVGFTTVLLYGTVGLLLGLLGGYLGGRTDWLISRLTEVGLTFPTFFLALIIMALQERSSLWTMMVAIGLTRWTDVARLVRAEVLRLKALDFIQAARACGAGPLRIMLRHLLPNALGPALVNATFGVSGAILAEAALTFLGFGTPPPRASWGEILSQGVSQPTCWWLVIAPGLMLFFTVVALNLVGEGVRDALDPRLRHGR